jgi:hypothetical protein
MSNRPSIVVYARRYPKGTEYQHPKASPPLNVKVSPGGTVFYHDTQGTRPYCWVDGYQWDNRRKTIMLDCARRRVYWIA